MIQIFSYDLDHTYSNNLHNRISQVRLGQFCHPYLKQKICIYSSSHWVSAAYIISSVSRSVLNPFIGEWPIHGNADLAICTPYCESFAVILVISRKCIISEVIDIKLEVQNHQLVIIIWFLWLHPMSTTLSPKCGS